MRACKINISIPLLLETVGLEKHDDLTVYAAEIYNDGVVTLYLQGDHPDLPEINPGDEIPQAQIICHKIESKIQVLP